MKAITLRMPEDIYKQIKKASGEKHTNVTQFIIGAVKQSLGYPTLEVRVSKLEEKIANIEKNLNQWM